MNQEPIITDILDRLDGRKEPSNIQDKTTQQPYNYLMMQ